MLMVFLSHRRLSRLGTFLLHDVSVTGRKQIRKVLCSVQQWPVTKSFLEHQGFVFPLSARQ